MCDFVGRYLLFEIRLQFRRVGNKRTEERANRYLYLKTHFYIKLLHELRFNPCTGMPSST